MSEFLAVFSVGVFFVFSLIIISWLAEKTIKTHEDGCLLVFYKGYIGAAMYVPMVAGDNPVFIGHGGTHEDVTHWRIITKPKF